MDADDNHTVVTFDPNSMLFPIGHTSLVASLQVLS